MTTKEQYENCLKQIRENRVQGEMLTFSDVLDLLEQYPVEIVRMSLTSLREWNTHYYDYPTAIRYMDVDDIPF